MSRFLEYFKPFINDSISYFQKCNEIFDTGFEFEIENDQLLYEAVIQVHKKVADIINNLESNEPFSLDKMKSILNNYNISLTERMQTVYFEGVSTSSGNIIIYHKHLDNKLFESTLLYHLLLKELGIVLVHEFVHVGQYAKVKQNQPNEFHDILLRSASKNIYNEKEYLSHPREIMAFAATIYQELLKSGLNKEEIKKLFNYGEYGNNSIFMIIQNSKTAKEYFNLFKKDDKVLKKLFKNIYAYTLKEQ